MEPDRWLGGEEGRLWLAFLVANRTVERVVEHRLRAVALTHGEFEVLARLSMAPGQRLRMGALTSLLVSPKSRLNYQVGRLEDRGLVRREPDRVDARGLHATLTEAGAQAFEHAAKLVMATAHECLIEPLTPAQRHALLDAMTTICRAVRPPP